MSSQKIFKESRNRSAKKIMDFSQIYIYSFLNYFKNFNQMTYSRKIALLLSALSLKDINMKKKERDNFEEIKDFLGKSYYQIEKEGKIDYLEKNYMNEDNYFLSNYKNSKHRIKHNLFLTVSKFSFGTFSPHEIKLKWVKKSYLDQLKDKFKIYLGYAKSKSPTPKQLAIQFHDSKV